MTANKILIPFLILLYTSPLFSMPLSKCETLFLEGKKISFFLEEELKKNETDQDQNYLKILKKISSCQELLSLAQLKSNGILKDRWPISSAILKSFNAFHSEWLTPFSESITRDTDKYQWDIFDKYTPGYHLTRSFFQKDQPFEKVLTAYGDLRVVKSGENLTISPNTQLSGEKYQYHLGTEAPYEFRNQNEWIGFLYKAPIYSEPRFFKTWSFKNQWSSQLKIREKYNLYQHFGGGILGSPSYLYHHLRADPLQAFTGRERLPRHLAKMIYQSLLCEDEDAFRHDETPLADNTQWHHPLNQESSCLECHNSLDQFAAGFRNIIFIPSTSQCTDEKMCLLLPFSLKAEQSENLWTHSNDFSKSYPKGLFKGDTFTSIHQLGKLIIKRDEFYQCAVKRYYHWIHQQDPPQKNMQAWANELQKHQNLGKLMSEILSYTP